MPWNAQSFRNKARAMSRQGSERGAAAANEVLRRTGDEGQAIRVGIAVGKGKAKHKKGKRRPKARPLPMPAGM